ncbi:hypothetical protein ACLOAU_09565 [Niabella sp. CJ426]|uniref:hypothetical protein n=1 Tax=Niabella sp. CJ426 TaxID=3393740 RepID=UPI003D06AE9D
MRKNICILVMLLSFGIVINSNAQTFTVSPGSFKAKDSITITMDVTGSTLEGKAPLYIWAFLNNPPNPVSQGSPNGVVGGNGSWTSSNETLKMKSLGNNKWEFGLRPTTFFAESVANIVEIGFLVKTKDGSAQSRDLSLRPDPAVFNETQFRVFPPKVAKEDVVTINFNQSLASSINSQRMQVDVVEVAAYNVLISGNNVTETQVNTTKSFSSVSRSGTNYSYSFLPSIVFGSAYLNSITRIKYRFGGKIPGNTTTVFSDWATYDFSTLTY